MMILKHRDKYYKLLLFVVWTAGIGILPRNAQADKGLPAPIIASQDGEKLISAIAQRDTEAVEVLFKSWC